MTATTLEATPTSVEPTLDNLHPEQLLAEEIGALTEGSAQFLRPPFAGGTVWKPFNPYFFEAHDRQYPNRGEVVIQFWMKRRVFAIGRAESVLWHNLRVNSPGRYRVVVRAQSGPITSIAGARCSVRSFVGGVPGGASSSIGSYQGRDLSYTVQLEANRTYRLFTVGSVLIAGAPASGPLPYGEVITSFPQVIVFPSAVGMTDPFQDHLDKSLATDDSEEALEALAAELPTANLYGEGALDD